MTSEFESSALPTAVLEAVRLMQQEFTGTLGRIEGKLGLIEGNLGVMEGKLGLIEDKLTRVIELLAEN